METFTCLFSSKIGDCPRFPRFPGHEQWLLYLSLALLAPRFPHPSIGGFEMTHDSRTVADGRARQAIAHAGAERGETRKIVSEITCDRHELFATVRREPVEAGVMVECDADPRDMGAARER